MCCFNDDFNCWEYGFIKELRMKKIFFLVLVALWGFAFSASFAAQKVMILTAPEASETEVHAGKELSRYLRRIYPEIIFKWGNGEPEKDAGLIFIGTPESSPALVAMLGKTPQGPEGFFVSATTLEGKQVGVILGADPAGVMNGIYALLKNLGFVFTLNRDFAPVVSEAVLQPFNFSKWNLVNRPLFERRLSFNWTSFLTTGASWQRWDWNRWISQSQKLGFNSVMIHFYADSPMLTFSFNDQEKPYHHVPTTIQGRAWRTQHVNDVRRMVGGEIFRSSAFGLNARKTNDFERVRLSKRMFRRVFASAKGRGMKLYFAFDVDTLPAQPQNLIETLPESARFKVSVPAVAELNQSSTNLWLANPDTDEGYAYYESQLKKLMTDYPQITSLVLWCRTQKTPWMSLKYDEMPSSWKRGYDRIIFKNPKAKEYWNSCGIFGMSKLIKTYSRILKEMERSDVEICLGSKGRSFLPAADCFCSTNTPLIFLGRTKPWIGDLNGVKKYTKRRAIIPIFSSSSDVFAYYGKPYLPFSELTTKLEKSGVAGVGQLHFMTRPQELVFSSVASQLWEGSRDCPLKETCLAFSKGIYDEKVAPLMAEYITQWMKDSPMVGQERGYHFITWIKPLAEVKEGIEKRLALLDEIEQLIVKPEDVERLLSLDYINYFRGMEKFMLDLHSIEEKRVKVLDLIKKGDLDSARTLLRECDPETMLKEYAAYSVLGGSTKGEKGLLISLNLRWRTWYVQMRQALGMELIRYNFGPTVVEPTAQDPGQFTFFFESTNAVLWQTFGEVETGKKMITFPRSTSLQCPPHFPETQKDVCLTGMIVDEEMTFQMQPIMGWEPMGKVSGIHNPASALQPGEYKVALLLTTADSKPAAISITVGSKTKKVNIFAKNVVIESFSVQSNTNSLPISVEPISGIPVVCGAVLKSSITNPVPVVVAVPVAEVKE